MKETFNTLKFRVPVEIDMNIVREKEINLDEICIIRADRDLDDIAKVVTKNATLAGINVIAITLEGAVVSGPSIDKISCILKEK